MSSCFRRTLLQHPVLVRQLSSYVEKRRTLFHRQQHVAVISTFYFHPGSTKKDNSVQPSFEAPTDIMTVSLNVGRVDVPMQHVSSVFPAGSLKIF